MAGHPANAVDEGFVGATIAGGGRHTGSVDNANQVAMDYGTIGGGRNNTVDSPFSPGGATVGGGLGNEATGPLNTIAGGRNNETSNMWATVGGGEGNTADGGATVAGGNSNTATGGRSMIPGGVANEALGPLSFAAGNAAIANANHKGTFVWADDQGPDHLIGWEGTPFSSVAANEFADRATGGVRFVTDIDGNGNPTSGATLASGGSSWNAISDRDAKTGIEDADVRDVLARVIRMPISEYSYKSQDASIRHMGPMAQDFHPLFGLGEDELRIGSMNLSGVALAAIQGLHAELEERDQRITELEERLEGIEATLAGD